MIVVVALLSLALDAPVDPASAPTTPAPAASTVAPIPPAALGKPVAGFAYTLDHSSADERDQLDRYLADLKGQQLSEDVLDKVRIRLAAVRKYNAVACAASADALITCTLARARILRDVKITGLPLAILETDVRKRVFLKPGEPLDDEDNTGKSRLSRQKQRIEELLDREGFMGANVGAHPHKADQPGEYDVIISVSGGAFVRVRRVVLKSFGPLSQRELRDSFGRMCLTSDGLLDGVFIGNLTSCFNRRRLQSTVESFVDQMHALGYPEARLHATPRFVDPKHSEDTDCALSPQEMDKLAAHGLKPAPQCVDLLIDVEPGTKVTARFELEHHPGDPVQKRIVPTDDLFPSTFLWVRETFLEPISRVLQLLSRAPPSAA
ncbi:MAG TPA: hypothetical protein VGO62_19770, partial [Myxococcota bacterium]